MELVETARLTPSAANRQPVRYKLVCDEVMNEKVFECLGWAGYLKDWDGPVEGERPAAYIVMAEDLNVGKNLVHDQGIAAQTILLGAVEKSYGGCMIYTVKRSELASIIKLPANLEIVLVLALGVPVEEVVIEPLPSNGDIKYWRDEEHIHHVPKRDLKDIVVNF